jgi:hypothetical protein
MANHEQELNTAIREVLKRSVVDPDFRQLATKNSSAALEKIGRKDLANATQITFIDNYGKSQKTIVLPDPIANPELLTEEDLEQVAGGCTATSCGTSA